jgi:hypothetical protein
MAPYPAPGEHVIQVYTDVDLMSIMADRRRFLSSAEVQSHQRV